MSGRKLAAVLLAVWAAHEIRGERRRRRLAAMEPLDRWLEAYREGKLAARADAVRQLGGREVPAAKDEWEAWFLRRQAFGDLQKLGDPRAVESLRCSATSSYPLRSRAGAGPVA